MNHWVNFFCSSSVKAAQSFSSVMLLIYYFDFTEYIMAYRSSDEEYMKRHKKNLHAGCESSLKKCV